MNFNVIKLWKQILKLQSVVTDKAELIVESEMAEGVEVFVEKEGEIVPAEDGEYVAEDKVIVVADGKVAEIRVKEEEKPEEDKVNEDVVEEEQPAEDEPKEDEKDSRIAELEAKVSELEAMLEEKDAKIAEMEGMIAEKEARIAELEASINEKDNELNSFKMSTELPAKEKVKKEEKPGALKFFK